MNAALSVVVSPSSGQWIWVSLQRFRLPPVAVQDRTRRYQWYVNGSAQSGQTASTFSFAPSVFGFILDYSDRY